jgi:hypothetical protein
MTALFWARGVAGAFDNHPDEFALIERALRENFNGAYRRVVFAILDWSAKKRCIGPFERFLKST